MSTAPTKMTLWDRARALVPDILELERVPLKIIFITIASSAILLIGSIYYGFPLWGQALVALLPWFPVFFMEAAWKYEHYGFYAFLGVFVILQIGHLAEHTVQVLQLLINEGDVTVSHGVFGELDRELVHFAWDSFVWLGVGAVLYVLGPHNKWLWISFIAASFHEVEHVFLFYLDRFQGAFYEAGGTTGILAKGGLIGTPLQRPYLHYVYNFFVVLPLIMAFWDETKRAYNVWLAQAMPSLSEQEKVSTTSQLATHTYQPGEVIIQQGSAADNFYILSSGEVEVSHERADGSHDLVAILQPGQFFGEMGLLTGKPRMATVKARTEVQCLSLDRDEFTMLVTRSKGGAADIDSELHERLKELKAGGHVDAGSGNGGVTPVGA